MNVRFLPHIESPSETECLEKIMLQDGYLYGNIGSSDRTGWDSIIWSFMISESPDSLTIMEGIYGV